MPTPAARVPRAILDPLCCPGRIQSSNLTLKMQNCPLLESLPPEIAALQQLKALEITGCGNLILPVELTTLQELDSLKVDGIRDDKSIPAPRLFPKLQKAMVEG